MALHLHVLVLPAQNRQVPLALLLRQYLERFGRSLDFKALGYTKRKTLLTSQTLRHWRISGDRCRLKLAAGTKYLTIKSSPAPTDSMDSEAHVAAAEPRPDSAAAPTPGTVPMPVTALLSQVDSEPAIGKDVPLPLEPGVHTVTVPKCVFRRGTSTDTVPSLTLKFDVAEEPVYIPPLTAGEGRGRRDADGGTITLNPVAGVPRRMVEWCGGGSGGSVPGASTSAGAPPILQPDPDAHGGTSVGSMAQEQEYILRPNTAVATVEISSRGPPLLESSGE